MDILNLLLDFCHFLVELHAGFGDVCEPPVQEHQQSIVTHVNECFPGVQGDAMLVFYRVGDDVLCIFRPLIGRRNVLKDLMQHS